MSTTNEDDDLEAGFVSDATAGQSTTDSLEDDAQAQAATPEQSAEETSQATTDDQTAQAEPEPDPLAGLPQAVRDMLADYQRTKVELDQIRRHVGQVPALQARIDKLTAHQAPPAKAEPEKPRLPKTLRLKNEGLQEIAEANEEVYDDLSRRIDELASALPPKTTPEAAPTATTQAGSPDAVIDAQMEALDEVRPGWSDLVFGNPFQLWLSTQPSEYQAEVRGASKAKVILQAIGKFEQQQARTQTTQQASDARTRRMAAAVTPRGDGRATARAPVDDEDADLVAGFNRATY